MSDSLSHSNDKTVDPLPKVEEKSFPALVQIDGVMKSFGDKIALKNVTFSVPSGQICGLLGPNGAGKTTLFRLLMGILKATEGQLLIDGLDAFEDRVAVKRLIGFLPDEPVFYSYLSGREVLELSAAMHGLDVSATMARIAPIMAKLRLSDDINNYAEDYSRGMKKKLGLLLAMLHDPKLLVLDEPTNGLDVESTHLFYDLIFETARRGTTVLFSTHLMDHVTRLCSHAVIINEGALIAKGSLEASLRVRRSQSGRYLPETDRKAPTGMKNTFPAPPGFLRTVMLLLRAARRRSAGRGKRQQELFNNRTRKSAFNWGAFGFVFGILLMAGLNACAAFVVREAVLAGERIEAERQGKMVVSRTFLNRIETVQKSIATLFPETDVEIPGPYYSGEAREIAEKYGGSREVIERKLRDGMRRNGMRDFITAKDPSFGMARLPGSGPFPAMWGSIVLVWWAVMLIFQGEGLELDLQRRRHPMWEWLFSHPVGPGAVFLAEMLSPIAANPIYWGAPVFVGVLYGFVYGGGLGCLAALLIGVPVAIAAACLGKALEIGAILRLSSRSRGAMIGLMSWMGYASMMLFFVGLIFVGKAIGTIGRLFDLFTSLPWPWLSLFLGGHADGSFSFFSGMLTCWAGTGVTVAGAVGISVWGAQKGLSGNAGQAGSRPSVSPRAGKGFGKDPLYRKEFLWFIRDRSAIVQAILIPMTVAGFQLLNFRSFLGNVLEEWNYLCGAAILFGTYFLWILGPRSLASEGTALWIALTWPRGLESLLKAKAWLWSMIASCMVAFVLCFAAWLFPANIPGIILVGIGWFFFGRSIAEKSVTLVTVPSSSGEAEKIPQGRRWAAQLGMLTFSIGVFTHQWPTAVIGIVYSYMTAAAMWQNFRARLPYLYDPWSEKLPAPPTLMHAMIAISIMVEVGAVITGILVAVVGREGIAVAQSIGYSICAVGVSIGMMDFLSNRGVALRDVFAWPPDAIAGSMAWLRYKVFRKTPMLLSLIAGAAGGLLLGMLALGYLAALQHIPAAAEILRKSQEQMAGQHGLRISFLIMGVGFAPFAEEYLFRGLLFRALDREWGGWRAIIGSAAFFAIYHGPLSWPPVACVGMVNALLFKKSGRLMPAVVLHMVYNAVVVLAM